jgi:hypothetical protein
MVKTIIREAKKAGQKKSKDEQPTWTKNKERRELVLLVVGSYLTHGPSNVTCMQIVRSNNNGKSKTPIICQCQCNFLSTTEAKAHWKAMLTRCLKNWMQKDKDKWSPNHLSWKRWTHFLMKQPISYHVWVCRAPLWPSK